MTKRSRISPRKPLEPRLPHDVAADLLLAEVAGQKHDAYFKQLGKLWAEVAELRGEVERLQRVSVHEPAGIYAIRKILAGSRYAHLAGIYGRKSHAIGALLVSSELVDKTLIDETGEYPVTTAAAADERSLLEKDLHSDLVPTAFVKFFSLSVAVIAVFGTLLVLVLVFGVRTIHPFLLVVGFFGGIGWLYTAWGDVRDWRSGRIARRA